MPLPILAACLIALAYPTLAATATALPNAVSDTTAYLDPIIQTVLQVMAMAIASVAIWAITRVAQHFGLKVSAEQSAQFDGALTKLVQSGVAKANDLIEAHGWDHVAVKNATIAGAMTGAAAKFPDALAGVGLSPDDPAFGQKLREALERIYPAAMAEVAASPATPPAPAPPHRRDPA